MRRKIEHPMRMRWAGFAMSASGYSAIPRGARVGPVASCKARAALSRKGGGGATMGSRGDWLSAADRSCLMSAWSPPCRKYCLADLACCFHLALASDRHRLRDATAAMMVTETTSALNKDQLGAVDPLKCQRLFSTSMRQMSRHAVVGGGAATAQACFAASHDRDHRPLRWRRTSDERQEAMARKRMT
ncbi:hypothetical protein ABH994_005588 [Bradyrhizobium yuanmingense]